MQGHSRQMAHSEECWWNKVYWRRKWQITPVFLTWESQVKYVKAKRCDTRSLGPKLEGIQYATGEEQLPLVPKWMKQIGQSKNDPQSWMCPLVKVKSNVVRNILHRNLECYGGVCVCVCVSVSVMSDSAIPWTVADLVSLSMVFSRQEYWIVLPFPSPGNFPNPGIKPRSPTLQVDSLLSEPPRKPG